MISLELTAHDVTLETGDNLMPVHILERVQHRPTGTRR